MTRPDPCFNCGSRASCRHREVEDVQLPPLGRIDHRERDQSASHWGVNDKTKRIIAEAMKLWR